MANTGGSGDSAADDDGSKVTDFNDLNPTIKAKIFNKVGRGNILNCRLVSKTFFPGDLSICFILDSPNHEESQLQVSARLQGSSESSDRGMDMTWVKLYWTSPRDMPDSPEDMPDSFIDKVRRLEIRSGRNHEYTIDKIVDVCTSIKTICIQDVSAVEDHLEDMINNNANSLKSFILVDLNNCQIGSGTGETFLLSMQPQNPPASAIVNCKLFNNCTSLQYLALVFTSTENLKEIRSESSSTPPPMISTLILQSGTRQPSLISITDLTWIIDNLPHLKEFGADVESEVGPAFKEMTCDDISPTYFTEALFKLLCNMPEIEHIFIGFPRTTKEPEEDRSFLFDRIRRCKDLCDNTEGVEMIVINLSDEQHPNNEEPDFVGCKKSLACFQLKIDRQLFKGFPPPQKGSGGSGGGKGVSGFGGGKGGFSFGWDKRFRGIFGRD